MKDKTVKLFGLFMTLALLAGLAGVNAMSAGGSCSAVTSSLTWTPITVPDGTHYQLYPGSDVGPMAVTSDGGTLFAAVLDESSGNWNMLKSTDGGYTWKRTGFPTGSTEIVAVKLSPAWSSDGTVYVATDTTVYKSKDRGNIFNVIYSATGADVINSLDVGRDADGDVVVVGNSTDVSLFDGGAWTSQDIGSYNVLAVGLSPNYASDGTVVAVVNSSTQTLVKVKTKHDTNWGGTITDGFIRDQNSSNVVANRACIGFPSDYNITSAPSLFVGLSTLDSRGDVFRIDGGDRANLSGVTGVTDLNVRSSPTNIWSMAVYGNTTADSVILAGTESVNRSALYSQAQALLYTSSNGGGSWSTASKPPTGETHATVIAASTYAYIGTGGIQSAVSVAATGAYTSWNQRGLIDTSIDEITDMAPSSTYFTDNTIYMTTLNATTNNASLWRTLSGGETWERIYCSTLYVNLSGYLSSSECAFNLVRIFGDTIIIAVNGGTLIQPSSDQGATFNYRYFAPANISAFAVQDASIFYVGVANGSVWETTGSGAVGSWNQSSSDGDIPLGAAVVDLVVKDGVVYAGTSGGGVYSTDTSDFTFVQVGPKMPGVAGDIVKVVQDDEDFVYAGIRGGAAQGIWRFDQSDDKAEWVQIGYEFNRSPVGDISALASAESGVLYAIGSNIGWYSVVPTSAKGAMFYPIKDGLNLGASDSITGELKLVSDTSSDPGSDLLFAVGAHGGNPAIWTTSNEVVRLKLLAPASGSISGDVWENGSYAGEAHVSLWWKAVADAELYEVQIASDANFVNVLDKSYFESGSQYTANNMTQANLWSGHTYYWRVRAVAPTGDEPMSRWSDNWSFITPLGPKSSLPELLRPAAGQSDVSLRPVLQWNNSLAATSYELVLTENCNPSKLVLNLTGDKKLGAVTAYQVPFDLKPNTNYCWKVRGLSDISNSLWSDTGSFTTTATTAPVVVEKTGAQYWVWIIIALGAVLIVAVVVLVVRTRRPV